MFAQETLSWMRSEAARPDGFNGAIVEVAANTLYRGNKPWVTPDQGDVFAERWERASNAYFDRICRAVLPPIIFGGDAYAPDTGLADGLLIEDFIHRFVEQQPAKLADWYEDAWVYEQRKRGILWARLHCGTAEHTVAKTLWHNNHVNRAIREELLMRDLVTTQLFGALWSYVIANPTYPHAPKTIIGVGPIAWPAVLTDGHGKLREWGQPLGEYTRTYGPPGPNAYVREFERCTISLNLATLEGSVRWK